MTAGLSPDGTRTFSWGHAALEVEIVLDEAGAARLLRIGPPGEAAAPPGAGAPLPLVEVTAAGHGRNWSGSRLVDTALGGRLRYRAHSATREGDLHVLVVELHDPDSGLAADVVYRSPAGTSVLRAEVTVRNEGGDVLHLESVTSLVAGCLTTDGPAGVDAADLLWAENDWTAECRWQRRPMRLTSPVLSDRVVHRTGRSGFAVTGQGTWSSCGRLPMGGLTDRRSGRTWLWQIEHNGGGWHFECGDRGGVAYTALSGPCDAHHGWRQPLRPGDAFTTVPVALAFCPEGGPDGAFAELTNYRRATRRAHPDHEHLPVIFNDYMNCLMGDPTTEKLLPLVDAAAQAGAEYFVIDAGWYDDDAGGWWTTVGAWEAAASRFPGPAGIHEVLDRIRDRGMVPGLWLEPEAVGVDSPVAGRLPDEAFFRRDGVRVAESGRHHLDLRHPAARAHLDGVVDRLVGEWGVGYLKLDHNIDPGSGTSSRPAETPGAGLLGHNRAHLGWLDGVLDRHPGLVLENCASGGMRWDHALLSRLQLQSTSDQRNALLYAPIAASAPTAATPEQGAVWAYPQPEDSPDEVAFTMANALLGRIHLSGRLTELRPEARALVQEAVAVHKEIRADLRRALPCWPLGLPAWDDPWIALAMRTPATTYLTAWRRPGGRASAALHVPHLAGLDIRVEARYPATGRARAAWDPGTARLDLTLPTAPSAVLLRLTRADADAHPDADPDADADADADAATDTPRERTDRLSDPHAADAVIANPVIPGFHPDPSVCRVGDDYYLACSSFEYFPGVPLFHSRDLVHWTQIGNVLDRPSQLRLPPDTPSSAGVYAPTLRHHDGRFHLIVTNVSDGGNLLVTATDPAGPWSEPVRLPGVPGIDPDLAWDEDGTCWCTVAGVSQVRIDPRTGRTSGPPRQLWSGGPAAQAPEAPHLYRIGEFWYLLIAEGGTERGHAVSVARGPAPSGPFEPCPANPVLTHRGTSRPIQNTGHADLVQAPDGSWWMVLLGVRPRGGTPGWHVLGRETFLVPVTWVDGWPVVAEVPPELPAPPWPLRPGPAPADRDDFDGDGLRPYWLSLRDRPAELCTTAKRDGWLTLTARGGSMDDPGVVFVGRRQQHLACRVRALLDPAEGRGGLAVRLDEDHHYEIEADGAQVALLARIGPLRTVVATRAVPAGPVVLRLDIGPRPAEDSRSGPDLLAFGVEAADATFTELGVLDGRYLSTEVGGGFTGRVIGMYAAAGTVHIDWFDYQPEGTSRT